MATITSKQRKTGLVYYIVYNHTKEDGSRKQNWIRCNSLHDAYLLLPEVEDYERRNLIYPIPQENQRYRIAIKARKAADCERIIDRYPLVLKDHWSKIGSSTHLVFHFYDIISKRKYA